MIFDSHSHTEFSGDSEMKGKDALKAAAKQGLGLVFTEHLDFDYPGDIDFTFDQLNIGSNTSHCVIISFI